MNKIYFVVRSALVWVLVGGGDSDDDGGGGGTAVTCRLLHVLNERKFCFCIYNKHCRGWFRNLPRRAKA